MFGLFKKREYCYLVYKELSYGHEITICKDVKDNNYEINQEIKIHDKKTSKLIVLKVVDIKHIFADSLGYYEKKIICENITKY